MKKIILLLFVSIFAFSVFAEQSLISNDAKIITAYKRKITEGIPQPELTFRIIDFAGSEVLDQQELELPVNARQNNYQTFTWSFSGNVFGVSTLKLTFYPMYLYDDNNQPVSTTTITYTASLKHTETRIGNSPIKTNTDPTTTTYITNDFATGYQFKYADSITESDSVEVSTTSKVVTITGDMSTKTKVSKDNFATTTDTIKNEYKDSASGSVCDYWNRFGYATINLDIDPTTPNKTEGFYFANVQVEVSMT